LQTRENLRKTEIFQENPHINSQERWRRDAVIDCDEQMQEIQKEIDLYKMRKEYAQMFVTNFEKYLFALSRELSRKTHQGENYSRV
jgi:hypothetical protein